MSYVVNSTTPTYPANNSYEAFELNANISLSWTFPITTQYIVGGYNDVTPTADGFVVTLPNATLADPGTVLTFTNVSGDYDFSINNYAGDAIYTLNPGDAINFLLYNNTTDGGLWRNYPYLGGFNGITAFSVTSDSLEITKGNVPADGNQITINISDDLNNIQAITEKGFAVVLDTEPLTWGSVSLVQGNNIVISNPDGTDGGGNPVNPIINVSPVLNNIDTIQVGNMVLDGNTIAIDANDIDLNFETSGTGEINLNGVTIAADGAITVSNLTVTNAINSPAFAKAWCFFTYISSTIAIESSFNVASISPVFGYTGYYEIFFEESMANSNYAVLLTAGTDGSSIPFVSHVYCSTRTTSSVVIAVVDASGQPLESLNYGISVVIY
jgi:hypothetical protein